MLDHYVWEKTYLAVRTLAMGRAPLRERLVHACIPSLISLSVTTFPDARLREQYEEIRRELMPDTGTLEEHLRNKSDEDVAIIADKIVSLYDGITRYMPEGS